MSATPSTQSNSARLAALLGQSAATAPPNEIFRGIDDDFWFWVNTEGLRISAALRQILPSLPSSEIQTNFTGASGDTTLGHAFAAYKLFKELYEYEGKSLATS